MITRKLQLYSEIRETCLAVQLTDTYGNPVGVCASAIGGGSSYGRAVILGTNFLRAYYTVYSLVDGNAKVLLSINLSDPITVQAPAYPLCVKQPARAGKPKSF